ncbi:MAG: 3-isopropylmalate dehydrogenase [Actinobacteria bacterium]|nr:3-isopropylmalate dehydrogenase [Actinomycetota bacterium]
MSRRIAVLAGDGIGPEVIAVGLERLDPSWEMVPIDAGAGRYLRTGDTITGSEVDAIRDCDALLLGAVGDPRVPDGVLERGILLRLRRELDLYVNLRPFPELGIVFVRENTEGLYAGVGECDEVHAFETSVNTRTAIQRTAGYAFRLARTRGDHLTWVHKTNVLTYAGGLWRAVVEDVSTSFPEVSVDYLHVDAAAYHLVRDPGRFDVVLTDNLFGDVLSDLAAGVGDGLGAAASANLHPDPQTRPQRCVGLFEPVHGSAPDIAGTGLADPSAAIGAVELLVDALEQEVAVT